MILKNLIIHNIASIEDAEIRFDQSPLADSEVFLITGKTGAGKSTILDAIALALYGKTPRFTNAKNNATGENTETGVCDERQVLRRGAGEGFVRLVFISNDNVTFEAEWRVRRANGRPDRNIQPKKWSLKNLDSGISYDKDVDIKAEIAKAMDLDFKQFCRTTMLAQGDFSRFLNSEDKEKADILEKITGMDEYSKIGKKINEIFRQKEAEWKDAQNKVDNVAILSDEEKKTITDTVATLDSVHATMKTELATAAEKLNWIDGYERLVQESDRVRTLYDQAMRSLNSAEFKEKEQRIGRWRLSTDPRRWLREIGVDLNAAERVKDEVRRLETEYIAFLNGMRFLSESVDADTGECERINTFIRSEECRIPAYERAGELNALLTSLSGNRKSIRDEQNKAEKNKARLNSEFIPGLQKAQSELDDAMKARDFVLKAVETAEREFENMNIGELRARRNNAAESISKATLAKEKLQSLQNASQRFAQLEQRVAQLENELKASQENLLTLAPLLEGARKAEDAAKVAYDSLKDSVDKFAIAMRIKLKSGDVCPVCLRKIDSAFHSEQSIKEVVEKAMQSYREAEENRKSLEGQFNRAKAASDAQTNSLNTEKASMEADKKALELMRGSTLTAIRAAGVQDADNDLMVLLTDIIKSMSEQKVRLDAEIKAAEIKETEIKELKADLQKKIDEVVLKEIVVRNATDIISQSNKEIEISESLISDKKSANTALEEQIADAVTGEWPVDWRSNPDGYRECLHKKAAEYRESKEKLASLQNAIKSSLASLADADRAKDRILSQTKKYEWLDWNSHAATEARNHPDIAKAATDLVEQLSQKFERFNILVSGIREKKEGVTKFLHENPTFTTEILDELNRVSEDTINADKAWLEKVRNASTEAATRSTDTARRLDDHIARKPEMADSDSKQSVKERTTELEELIKANREEYGSLKQRIEADNANRRALHSLIAEAQNKRGICNSWGRLADLLGDGTGSKFKKIAQSYVLDNLIASANHYMKSLSDRYQLRTSPGTLLIQVEDAYQGYATRATSTLSGGETFLVSLALALGLSDISDTLGVDTIFIDEGFGTLSGEPLQKAVSTLRSLHSNTGKHVGIISHIEELCDTIPVQIVVDQQGNSSTSTIYVKPLCKT